MHAIASGAVIAELVGHGDHVYSLALSPDGKTLASSAGDRTVRTRRTESSLETRRAIEARSELVAEPTPRVVRLLDELELPSAVAFLELKADQEGAGWERRLEVALQLALGEIERRLTSSWR